MSTSEKYRCIQNQHALSPLLGDSSELVIAKDPSHYKPGEASFAESVQPWSMGDSTSVMAREIVGADQAYPFSGSFGEVIFRPASGYEKTIGYPEHAIVLKTPSAYGRLFHRRPESMALTFSQAVSGVGRSIVLDYVSRGQSSSPAQQALVSGDPLDYAATSEDGSSSANIVSRMIEKFASDAKGAASKAADFFSDLSPSAKAALTTGVVSLAAFPLLKQMVRGASTALAHNALNDGGDSAVSVVPGVGGTSSGSSDIGDHDVIGAALASKDGSAEESTSIPIEYALYMMNMGDKLRRRDDPLTTAFEALTGDAFQLAHQVRAPHVFIARDGSLSADTAMYGTVLSGGFFKKLGNAIKKVGKAVGGVAKKVGKALVKVVNVVKSIPVVGSVLSATPIGMAVNAASSLIEKGLALSDKAKETADRMRGAVQEQLEDGTVIYKDSAGSEILQNDIDSMMKEVNVKADLEADSPGGTKITTQPVTVSPSPGMQSPASVSVQPADSAILTTSTGSAAVGDTVRLDPSSASSIYPTRWLTAVEQLGLPGSADARAALISASGVVPLEGSPLALVSRLFSSLVSAFKRTPSLSRTLGGTYAATAAARIGTGAAAKHSLSGILKSVGKTSGKALLWMSTHPLAATKMAAFYAAGGYIVNLWWNATYATESDRTSTLETLVSTLTEAGFDDLAEQVSDKLPLYAGAAAPSNASDVQLLISALAIASAWLSMRQDEGYRLTDDQESLLELANQAQASMMTGNPEDYSHIVTSTEKALEDRVNTDEKSGATARIAGTHTGDERSDASVLEWLKDDTSQAEVAAAIRDSRNDEELSSRLSDILTKAGFGLSAVSVLLAALQFMGVSPSSISNAGSRALGTISSWFTSKFGGNSALDATPKELKGHVSVRVR